MKAEVKRKARRAVIRGMGIYSRRGNFRKTAAWVGPTTMNQFITVFSSCLEGKLSYAVAGKALVAADIEAPALQA
jgi:hypothetical protein